MKRIGDKNFWIILITSIVVLLALTVGVIFLTRKSAKTFYDAGYIISSTALKTDKYYFDKDTVYKEDVFENYIFEDKDNKKVSTSKDNFIHYLDDSLSFMKNGVILDLDNFNKNLVPYYNITDKSIIKYSNGNYYIETADKKLVFGNFLGRITDDKYIAVGDIKIKLSGNEDYVSGKYFELLFVENGVVKISNNEGSYQTLTEGTTIYVGEKVKIDLGTKEVSYDSEVKLTLEEMTIDGNENIDIKEPDNKVKPSGNDKDKENEAPENNNPNNKDDDNKPKDGDNSENGNGETTNTIIKDELAVNLVSAEVDINTFIGKIQVIDSKNKIKGRLILKIYDVDHKETAYDDKYLSNTSDIQTISIGSLSPETNYYLTVKEEGTNNEYLSRNFRTKNLNLVLKREMVTTNSLSYVLDLSEDENVKSAKISIYEGENLIESKAVINGENTKVEFEGLKSNTTYNVRVDEIVFKNTNYSQVYTINTSDVTLKEKPIIGDIHVVVNENGNNFEISMDKPTDVNDSITKYTYKIYERFNSVGDNGEETNKNNEVYTFSSNQLKKEIVKIGENDLKENTDYTVKVSVEYYDNYKINEIETGYSDVFFVKGNPSVEFIEGQNDFNTVRGTLKLNDSSCTVSFAGRDECSEENEIYIEYSSINSNEKGRIEVEFNKATLEYPLDITGLKENTKYLFEVFAYVDFHHGNGREKMKIGNFTSTTKGIDALTMSGNWKQNQYISLDDLINVTTKISSISEESEIINKLNYFTVRLLDNNNREIARYEVNNESDSKNIKNNYYDNSFNITTKDFDINSLEELKAKTDGTLCEYYFIEVVEAKDDQIGTNKFKIYENRFKYVTPPMVLLEDTTSSPNLIVEPIKNSQAEDYGFAPEPVDESTIIGYKVTANNIDIGKITDYFSNIKTINFYAYSNDKIIETKKINFSENQIYTVYFKVEAGTEDNVVDEDLRRGNKYTFKMNITLDDNDTDVYYPSKIVESGIVSPVKQDPKIKIYVDSSTEDTITYKYEIKDYDKALYKDEEGYKLNYKLNGSEEEYTLLINNEASLDTFTLSNLTKESVYSIRYYRKNNKDSDPSLVSIGNYYFDGYHEKDNSGIDFEVEYQDFSNTVKILLTSGDEFLNRVSIYKLKLQSGDLKYETLVSEVQECDENKCIKVDYKDIANFKNKNITVSLEAFYDTGLVGYSNQTRLGTYFKTLGLVNDSNKDKVGYVFQIDNNDMPGRYLYLRRNQSSQTQFFTSDHPMGILGFDLRFPTKAGDPRHLDIGSVTSISYTNNEIINNGFENYGNININNNSFTFVERGIKINGNIIYPKVLDRVDLLSVNNTFKFTSITPKVTVGENKCNGTNCDLKPTINGASMEASLSLDAETLENDFVKTDDKYKFYIDIFDENDTLVKTVLTDYDNLQNIEFIGLEPDTTYSYKIAADMNKNGVNKKTYLFNGYDKIKGYVEYKNSFKTLGSSDIYYDMAYSFNSYSTTENYTNRNFNLKIGLKNAKNYDVKYQIFDNDNNLEYEKVIPNTSIVSTINSKYVVDALVMNNDFVFGNNSHRLVVYAVTTDLNKELELYNEYLKNETYNINYLKEFRELVDAEIAITPTATISTINNNNNYEINYEIVVEDIDRVIKDGIVRLELQNVAQQNACNNPDDCIIEVNLNENICGSSGSSTSKVKSCEVISTPTGSSFTIIAIYNNLNPDTNYLMYASADTYRNNVSLSEKEGIVYARKGQYTKSELNFSLGSPIIAFETVNNKKELNIVFVGASDVNNYIVGLEYSLFKEGSTNIGSNKIGIVLENNAEKDYGNLQYSIMEADDISLRLPIDGNIDNITGTISLAVTYYYYNSSNELTKLTINGNTVHSVYAKQ